MKEQIATKESMYVEKMHGFEEVSKELSDRYGCDFLYGDIETLTGEGTPKETEIVGIVKGPRTKLDAQILERIANIAPNPVIGYIGRHPEKILGEDVEYRKKKADGEEILLVRV